MDKVLEVVVVATIVIVIGAIMAYLVNDEANSFSDFIGGQSDQAKCNLHQGDDEQAFEENNCQEVLGETFQGSPTGSGPGTCADGYKWCEPVGASEGSCVDESTPAGVCR